MCGITGAAWTDRGQPIDSEVLARMVQAIAHRGPDADGFYFSPREEGSSQPGAALGHRRLSIIDLAGGQQPLSNEDGSIWIIFNGEIYNYRELRPILESQGHRFQTDSDTETIVHLYEEYGTDCVSHLRGMFAFAIWDQRKQRLFLARDRLGQKPLFYRQEDQRLLFASELKALLQVPDAPRELNPQALDAYLLYQYVPHPMSILKGYHKLPPGHWAVYEQGQLRVERYWHPPYDDVFAPNKNTGVADTPWTPERWQRELRNTLTEAVNLRMRSDVPLGAFLSGGVDSTIIAGLMQQLSHQPVHTFSIGFPVAQFDERAFAREAALHLGTIHHEDLVEPHAIEILPRLIWHYDEPFADSSAIPTMYLSQMTRNYVTVALSGDGGDELFAGYDRYKAVALGAKFDRLPGLLKKFMTWNLWQKFPASTRQKSFRRRLKRLLGALDKPPEERYLTWISIFDNDRRGTLYTDEFRRELGEGNATSFLKEAYQACPGRDFVTRTTCTDVLTYLPCDILTKVDVASMAVGLECRSPFLDHHVAELAARMPLELKMHHRRGKQILLETFPDLLPRSIRERPKMGFGVPLDTWFRGELQSVIQEKLLNPKALGRGYFQPEAVRRLVEEHQSGRWDHSYRLWSLLCFEEWHEKFLDSATPPANP
ncbi:MAG: asparagine synthase (glutamine-hydrolyzing) [Planctomycetaceae bacterium]|nr:asparagine synthase (glutamine-hydrolyzing) [Planctomycetaceae bacterium]